MMFQTQTKLASVEEFLAFALLPENSERNFELIGGEIIEKMPGTTRNSALAFNIGFVVQTHCQKNELPCFISTGDGAYRINMDVVAPDFAYKTTPMAEEYPDPLPPLWAIEVISANDKAADIRKKRMIYIDADILYWEMYPESRSIDVYAPGQPMKTVGIDGILDAGPLLPGFMLPAKAIWLK